MSRVGQDMPPQGGYPPIVFERIKQKRFISNWILGAFTIACAVHFKYRYQNIRKRSETNSLEIAENLIALDPFLRAERDRLYLKQLKINRDTEKDLMKNVRGWVVGTLYGQPIYQTTPSDRLPHIRESEFFIHRPKHDYRVWGDPEMMYI